MLVASNTDAQRPRNGMRHMDNLFFMICFTAGLHVAPGMRTNRRIGEIRRDKRTGHISLS